MGRRAMADDITRGRPVPSTLSASTAVQGDQWSEGEVSESDAEELTAAVGQMGGDPEVRL